MSATPEVKTDLKADSAAKPSLPVVPPSLKDSIQKILSKEPQRVQDVEGLVKLLKLQAPKDPQKQAESEQKVAAELTRLAEAGEAVEIDQGLFKARVFLDRDKDIEHFFIGGMGNTRCRFGTSIFRINMGVLSVFFVRDQKAGDWMITVRDTTIGQDYGISRRLRDGACQFGNRPMKDGETDYIQIKGRYIEPEHLTLTVSGESIHIEDHKTTYGTRIDFLIQTGVSRYQKAARNFMKMADSRGQKDIIVRGRFVLDQLLKQHQNYESSFFGAVVDGLLFGNA